MGVQRTDVRRTKLREAPATRIFIIATAVLLPTIAHPVAKRAVLGTIVASGPIEVANEPGQWSPGSTGSPVLEHSELRTGDGDTAMVALGTQGVIGLRRHTHLRVGGTNSPNGLPLSLHGESSVSFRLPMASALSFLTDTAVVKAGEPAADEASIRGIVSQQGEITTVRVISGNLDVRNRNATTFATVAGGEQATIASASAAPRITRMSTEETQSTTRRLSGLGFLGTKPGLIALGTAAAVGGGIGIAAAAGAFDSDDNKGGGEPVPSQGSPFTP
jgi:hypothetical protein